MEMEGGAAAAAAAAATEKEQGSSYTYWVRNVTEDAAPLPVPRKLNPQDLQSQTQSQSQTTATLGSVWNKAGTWEEKNLNKWATHRIKELLESMGFFNFSAGKAQISQVTKCNGDAFLVTVRNKKRVGYTYELTLKVEGEWTFEEEKKMVKGYIDVPEFSFGELDDLQVGQDEYPKHHNGFHMIEVTLNDERDLMHHDQLRIRQDLKEFLKPVREKLLQFEEELKDR